MTKLSYIFIAKFFFLYGCIDLGDNPPEGLPPNIPYPTTVSFQKDILPIFNNYRCITCHGDNGGLNLSNVNKLKTTGDHKPVVIVGDAEGSILIKKMRGTAGFGTIMPPEGMISEISITKISAWINQGAKDN